jgi:hypothetical protein
MIMKRLLPLIPTLALAAGCTAATPAPPPAAAATPDSTSVIRKLQNRWSKCLEPSYRIASTKTLDKNAAAEMAFAACASEEQDLTSLVNTLVPAAYNGIPALRSGLKQVLIEKGHLEIFPER